MRLRLGCSSGGVPSPKVSILFLLFLAFQAPTGLLLVSETLFFPSRKKKVIMYVRYVLEIGE